MRLLSLHCVVLFSLMASSGFAAQVLQIGSSQKIVAVSADVNRPWHVDDEVCFSRGVTKLGCGVVTKAMAKGAIVKLLGSFTKLEKGDTVQLSDLETIGSSKAAARKLSSKEPPPVISAKETVAKGPTNRFNWDLSIGAGASRNYYFGQGQIQFGLGNHLSIGNLFMISDASLGDIGVTTLSALLTLNYYSREPFRGIWVQAGAGPQLYGAQVGGTIESAYTLATLLTVGWRGKFEFPALNVGIGVGAMYITTPKTNIIGQVTANFQPTILFDLGWNF